MVDFDYSILDGLEAVTFALRALYRRNGFTLYRMGKFEEYELYSRNSGFLISNDVITFRDTNGKLMALKPDVTLSVIKNHRDEPDRLLKLCYNESVYRVSRGSNTFRELMQTGLECIGAVDAACVREVLRLAAESLALCSGDFVLEVSHLGILSAFVREVSEDPGVQRSLLRCAAGKNLHGIDALCRENGIAPERAAPLRSLLGLYGTPEAVYPRLRALCGENGLDEAVESLRDVLSGCVRPEWAGRVQIDFSAVSNMKYYNGVVFRGFLAGIPEPVLTGGQYDALLRKMGRQSRAVGFAVYLDLLDRLRDGEEEHE